MVYKLCYVESGKGCAYFTNVELKDQWGDDWDDIPYEHNAGEPYSDKNNIKKVYFELPKTYYTPCSNTPNSSFSVKDINYGIVAWIWTDQFKLFAGTTLKEFIRVIQENGGKIYIELERKGEQE